MFPYECKKCGGAYERCGNQKHKKCEGGQFCWSDNIVIVPKQFVDDNQDYDIIYNFEDKKEFLEDKKKFLENHNKIEGYYDGYGSFMPNNKIFFTHKNENYKVILTDIENINFSDSDCIVIICDIYCKSCF